jgi:hypothetical protein
VAWTNSKIFRQTLADIWQNTMALDVDTDIPKAALYNTTPTPDQNVTAALSAYNAATSQWVAANEVTDATNWVAGGRPLAGITFHGNDTAGVVWYDATDTSGAGNVTLAGVFGTLVYDDTLTTPVADQGICYNYFGGTQSVTAGTFTIVWNVNGIFRFTM